MTKIQFSHGNGFPAQSYEYLFSLLNTSNKKISYIETMGHAGYSNKENLFFLRDELIDEIEKNFTQPIIGLGHSAGGAATLLAATKRPDLFEKIILLDPVVFGGLKRLMISLGKRTPFWGKLSPANKALQRRAYFKDHQEARDYYKGKSLFKDFHPKCFDSYVKHCLKLSDNGMELKFSPRVEADIFRHLTSKFEGDFHQVQATIIYGDKSHLFWPSDVKWWKKNYPHFKLISFDGGHLFPLEQPGKTASMVNEILNEI